MMIIKGFSLWPMPGYFSFAFSISRPGSMHSLAWSSAKTVIWVFPTLAHSCNFCRHSSFRSSISEGRCSSVWRMLVTTRSEFPFRPNSIQIFSDILQRQGQWHINLARHSKGSCIWKCRHKSSDISNLPKKIVPSAQREEEGRRACPRSSRSRETLCRNTEEMDAKALQKQARGENETESHQCTKLRQSD